MPGREYNTAGTYRYGFNGKENDNEVKGEGNQIDFEARIQDPRLGRWFSIDPAFTKSPNSSPYCFSLNNPILLVDKDGNFPIIPLLLKMASSGAADYMTQVAMNYYFNDATRGDLSKSVATENINFTQVARSTIEGAIPWKTPGGKLGKAAATAVTDVLYNFAEAKIKGKDYSTELAVQDFAVGFISDLGGGEIGSLISKYGAKAFAKGLSKMGFADATIHKFTGLSVITGNRTIAFENRRNTGHLVKHADYLGVKGSAQELQKPQNLQKLKDAASNFVKSAEEVRVGKWDDTYQNAIFYRKGDKIIVTDKATGNFITAADNAAGNQKFNAAKQAVFSKEK